MKSILQCFILFFLLILIGCSDNANSVEPVSGDPRTNIPGLTPVEANITSENIPFYRLGTEKRKSHTYYKPVLLNEISSFLPDKILGKLNLNSFSENPLFFSTEEEAVICASITDNGKYPWYKRHDIQLSYLKTDSETSELKDFLIILITETDNDITRFFDNEERKYPVNFSYLVHEKSFAKELWMKHYMCDEPQFVECYIEEIPIPNVDLLRYNKSKNQMESFTLTGCNAMDIVNKNLNFRFIYRKDLAYPKDYLESRFLEFAKWQ